MKLIFIRHGQSQWNLKNRFTGWHDSELTPKGRDEATAAGQLLAQNDLIPNVVHTSILSRAVETTAILLKQFNIEVNIEVSKSWRLNERHYGDLTGKDKKQAVQDFGKEQVFSWRRKYDVPPPAITIENEFAKGIADAYSELGDDLPQAESLADVLERLLPYWQDSIQPDLKKFPIVMVSAHGNSLRALIKHLDNISDDKISELNIPTSIPLVYELNDKFLPTETKPIMDRFLGDAAATQKAAELVARQTGDRR